MSPTWDANDSIGSKDVQCRGISDLRPLALDATLQHPPIFRKSPLKRDFYLVSFRRTTISNDMDRNVNPERLKIPNTPHPYDPNSPRSSTPRTMEPLTRKVSHLPPSKTEAQLQPGLLESEQERSEPRGPELLLQMDSRPISQEQSAAKLRSIFYGMAVLESKSYHMYRSLATTLEENDDISHIPGLDDLQSVISLRRVILRESHDFSLASQHPSVFSVLRRAEAMPRMSHGTLMPRHDKVPLRTVMNKYIIADTDVTERFSDHVIPGLLNSQFTVEATGDTGAKYNFLNESFAKRCNFKIDSTFRRYVTIASGQKVMTTSIAEVFFCFLGERTPYPLKFQILPGCVKNVILGKSFLKATETFSDALNFAKRVVNRFTTRLNTQQVLFLGASLPMFVGLLNGQVQMALADSASKVLIMDECYAQMLGLSIVRTKETCIKLRFADGSTTFTSGKTYNVSWQFGSGKPYPLDFYVLKDAPANVILSEDFLLRQTKAFIEYASCLIENHEEVGMGYDDNEDDNYFFAIDRDENYHPQPYTQGAEQYFEDDHETSRRAKENLHIASLVGAEKDAAIARAEDRRAQWAAKPVANSPTKGDQYSTTNAASPSTAPQSQISNVAGVPFTRKRRRWWFRFMKKHKSGQTRQNG